MKADFTLHDKNGKEVSMKSLKGKWVVIYFYPKDLTPGCTIEAHEFTKALPKFLKESTIVLGISPDSEESHCRFYDKEKLKLTLLSDKDKSVAKKFGAHGRKKLYGREYEGIIRSTFLVNPDGEVVFSWKNVKPAGHAEAVLEKLKEMKKSY